MTTATTPQRNARGRARRAELLRAGMALARERGIEAVSVTDVTRRVGVSSALFYWYFRGIEHLLHDALAEGVAAVRRGLAHVGDLDDPLERVAQRFRTIVMLIETDEHVAFLLRADAFGWMIHPQLADVVTGGEDVLIDIVRDIAEGQARGDVRTDVSALLLAGCVRSIFADTVARYFRGETRLPLSDVVNAAASFAVQGVASAARITAADTQRERATER